jgi:dolichyl-phosphate-mannose-protein mannosyltransferase
VRAVLFDSENRKRSLSVFALRALFSKPSSSRSPELKANHAQTGFQSRFERATVFKAFAAIVAITFLLRIFYARHLYQDDGLWFTAAEEILRGKALYREIYFDKPPVIALVYAGLFKLFGASILTIRLFSIVYSITVSIVLYLFGKWFYDRRTGLVAAVLFAVFSTTYQEGHFHGLNTDFLMTLPYAAAAFLFVRSRADIFHRNLTRTHSAWLALGGGALAGVASQINPKAAFDLAFFALLLIFARRRQAKQKGGAQETAPIFRLSAFRSFAFAFAGFAIGAAPFLIYLAATKSLSFYWLYVWDWGARYARYYPAWKIALSALTQSVDYFLINNTLLAALLFVGWTTIKWAGKGSAKPGDAEPALEADFRADAALLIWLAASYAGLAMGGRFFGHYFFQMLPSLCLIGARGLIGARDKIALKPESETKGATRRKGFKRAIAALLVAGFVITIVRYHTRTALLAVDRARGIKSASTREWLHERLNREERMAAAAVTGSDEAQQASVEYAPESLRDESPRERGANGPSDYLFVWGYRPEIYYWSGLIPASKYLSTQPLTGVPADVHYFGDDYHSVLEESATQAARVELAGELKRARPEYIIDELGAFNSNLSINSYPELREVMNDYRNTGMIERFIIYRRKDFTKGYRKRNPESKP